MGGGGGERRKLKEGTPGGKRGCSKKGWKEGWNERGTKDHDMARWKKGREGKKEGRDTQRKRGEKERRDKGQGRRKWRNAGRKMVKGKGERQRNGSIEERRKEVFSRKGASFMNNECHHIQTWAVKLGNCLQYDDPLDSKTDFLGVLWGHFGVSFIRNWN